MAQLSNDCFAFGGALRRLDDALDDLAGRLQPVVATETVGLHQAQGRVLAADLLSPISIPGFDNSAVDGYAVRHADLAADRETLLPVRARIPAGLLRVPPLTPQTAHRIFTGAMMPEGADTVFMQEDVRLDGESVILPPGLKPGSNARAAGEDFAVGARILAGGTRLMPQHVAGLAAAGLARVEVRQRLRVAVFSTGNEIVDGSAGAPLPLGCQYDANRPMLVALLTMRGMEVIDLGVLPDDRATIARALAAAAPDCDAILTSGGVSTGEEDHVKSALEQAGKLDFWRLAIKPGRPVAMGMIAGRAFLGMPGNPAAVFVTFTRFVGPVLDMLAGARPLRPQAFQIESAFDYRKKKDRREYVRATLQRDQEGRIQAQRFPRDGAALISSLIAAEGFVELEEDRVTVARGESVRFLPFASLFA